MQPLGLKNKRFVCPLSIFFFSPWENPDTPNWSPMPGQRWSWFWDLWSIWSVHKSYSTHTRWCWHLCRVGILARLRVIDPLFFLWTHKFQLQLTITRPLGRACIHNGVNISHGKSLAMSHFCPPNYQNRVTCSKLAGELANRSKL